MARLSVLGLSLVLVLALSPAFAFAEAGASDRFERFTQPSGETSDSTLCGPFESSDDSEPTVMASAAQAMAAAASESGITAGGFDSSASASTASTPSDPGEILRLPAAGTEASMAEGNFPSEAILALPKNEAGQIPEDFELGPGASIKESFFSPVICATIARIVGPPGATLEQLVMVVPEGSALVANDVYASAATATTEPVAELPARPDPYASLQYGLTISGVRDAREVSRGEGVTIALLDSAPESEHRDLSNAESKALVEGTLPPVGVHGTLMAGVMTAIEGNGFGIAGLAPGARLVSVPICTPSGRAGGRCTIFQLLIGLDQAWDAGADLVNLSLSGPPNVLLERGVARLERLGAVVVAAAGNEGTDQKRYPAAYPTVIGVGATDRDGRRFEASNRGSWVELSAPGVNVLSTVPGNAFAFGNGTSLAAAHVTGVLAVVTGATGDAKRARAELFRTVSEAGAGRTPPTPSVCEIFEGMELACSRQANASDSKH